MASSTPRVCVVILNWNGWRDTIECLESVIRLKYPDFFLVIVDNGSTNDSITRIADWIRQSHPSMSEIEISLIMLSHEGGSSTPASHSQFSPGFVGRQHVRSIAILLISSAENLGFAAGSNLGMRIGMAIGCEHVWLLNNDTVVAPDSLEKLVRFIEEHPEFSGVTGQIRYYRDPNLTWNCGGSLLPLGLRRYAFGSKPVLAVPQTGYARITFMTGCAALFRASLIRQIGFLSERFFFGEEDFEICHRLKRNGKALACCYGAVIYHKVGASLKAESYDALINKAHVHYLNRFIHMRAYWSTTFWQCWRYAYCAYIVWLLRVSGVSCKASLAMLLAVLRESKELDGVDRATFNRLIAKPGSEAVESMPAI